MSAPGPTPLGLAPSFGFGDRLGTATPGHLAALMSKGGSIRGIFAQQSIREMTRTRRTPQQVMAAAQQALDRADYSHAWGADADHLKTPADVDLTAAAGFVFFTIDPSEHVDPQADTYPAEPGALLEQRFGNVRDQATWVGSYLGKTLAVPNGPQIEFDPVTVQRAAVKYGRAIAHTITLARHIAAVMAKRGKAFEIELSVDETPQPTTLAEHYIIADQLRQAGVQIVSLAPRYVGDFEKGIDYKGDIAAFERSLADHAAIARHLGPYKLSLHSGSDKLSIYASFARITSGLFHVKTAGTSYLEALRVTSRHQPDLFRKIVDFARGRFETDKATYHVSAALGRVPAPAQVADQARLEKLYLDQNDGRQILHVTFGSVLTDAQLGPAVHQVLKENPQTHLEVLQLHFEKHLAALTSGLGA
ncbi:MAG: hypothetical protein IT441_02270 [Phycisphaeraceae bacterium]|nr:hypothetical protein [Phycisphaeraceae bacterium]